MHRNPITISIIRESRTDDKRTPLVPQQVKELLSKYPNLKILVQPSRNRCFKDENYFSAGAKIEEDISNSDIILGVKEVDISALIENKTYLFFSHTSKVGKDNNQATQGTPGMSKKKLLKEILKKNITLIDYENIRDISRKGYRYLGFGRFAGIVGCYNTLNLHLKIKQKRPMPRAFEVNDYKKIKEIIAKQSFKNLKILLTGDGRVAKGSLEFLKYTNIKQISLKDYLTRSYEDAVYCNIPTSEYVEHNDGRNFSIGDFIKNPQNYNSKIKKYLVETDILISSHYWDPKSPKLFDLSEIKEFKNLKIIGDITCDINGSIPTTIRSSSILKPYYAIDKKAFKETSLDKESIAIMAVDNLPSELPSDSSEEFGKDVLKEVLPYLLKDDDGRISRATITSNGNFCSKYNYLKDFIK